MRNLCLLLAPRSRLQKAVILGSVLAVLRVLLIGARDVSLMS